jgi:hypothetical protein
MVPPITPETAVLAVAYLGMFLGTYLVIRNLSWFSDADAAAEPGAETVACPECGRENQVAFVYCRHCATELAAGEPTTAGVAS